MNGGSTNWANDRWACQNYREQSTYEGMIEAMLSRLQEGGRGLSALPGDPGPTPLMLRIIIIIQRWTSNAAFDIESSGKCIEAVSFVRLPFRLSNLLRSTPLLLHLPSISADHNMPFLRQYRRQTGVRISQFRRKWR